VEIKALTAVGGFGAELLEVSGGGHGRGLRFVGAWSARTSRRSPICRSRAMESGIGWSGAIV
jgi:DNA gyrase/topoisomerase IV subunit B